MSRLQDEVDANRAALAAGNRDAVKVLQLRWVAINNDLRTDFRMFLRAWETARKEVYPLEVSPTWEKRNRDYITLIDRYQSHLEDAADLVAAQAVKVAQLAIVAGATDADKLATLVTRVANTALIEPAAFTSATVEAGPLAELIKARAPQEAQIIADILTSGVARGTNPRVTAGRIKRAAGGTFARSAMVVRTEQMRSYRQANAYSYATNPAVNEWVWSSRCTSRTCAACWAMEGKIFPVSQPMESHPNCMCVPVPYVEGAEYGVAAVPRFAAAPAQVQRDVLGPTAYGAYKAGALSITQMARTTTNPDWGGGLSRTPLRELLSENQRKKYLAAGK